MDQPKEAENSLEFLRWFDRYAESFDLADRVRGALEKDRTRLELRNEELTSDDLKVLIGMEPLASLRFLSLANTRLNNDGAAYLAACPFFSKMEHLDIEGNSVGDEGLFLLTKSSILSKLLIGPPESPPP